MNVLSNSETMVTSNKALGVTMSEEEAREKLAGLQQKFKDDFRAVIDNSERKNVVVMDRDLEVSFSGQCNGLGFKTPVISPDNDIATDSKNIRDLLSFFAGDVDYDPIRKEVEWLLGLYSSLKTEDKDGHSHISNQLFIIANDTKSVIIDRLLDSLSEEARHYSAEMDKCQKRSAGYFKAVELVVCDLFKEVLLNEGDVLDVSIGDSFGHLLDVYDTLTLRTKWAYSKMPHLQFSHHDVEDAHRLTAPSVFVTCQGRDGFYYVMRIADFDDGYEWKSGSVVPCVLNGKDLSSVDLAESARDYQLVVDSTSTSVWDLDDDGELYESMGGSDTADKQSAKLDLGGYGF